MIITTANQTEAAGMMSGIPEAGGVAASLRQEYLRAILAGKRKPALEIIMGAYHGGYSIAAIYMDILQEALYEVGRLWETNQITVADEHMGTAITQFVMSYLYQYLEISTEQRGKLVITGVQGELHQVGAHMVADILEADGWDTRFLGTNVPARSVIKSIRLHGANLFGISSTMLANIPRVLQLVEAVRNEFGESVKIILGGGAFKTGQKLPLELTDCAVALNLRAALDMTRKIRLKPLL